MRSLMALATLWLLSGCGNSSEAGPATLALDFAAAAPGRVEGARETLRLGTSIQALVEELLVEEGDRVKAGQLLVELDCGEYQAEAEKLRQQALGARFRLRVLEEGPRPEEIADVEARTRAARAEVERAAADLARMRQLVQGRVMPQARLDQAERDERSAAAHLESAEAREELLRTGARREELLAAAADARAFERAHAGILKKLELCRISSPVDGIVLRTHVTEGELVTPLKAEPLVSVSDLSRRRVRAELDELDVGLVSPGQKARVLTDTHPPLALQGVVAMVAPAMGRRRTLSTDPAEKSDRDVLEVLIDLLDDRTQLPVDLRVTVQFLEVEERK